MQNLTSTNSKISLAVLFVIGAALARVLPHWPNVTPIFAMALFGGVYLSNRATAIAIVIGSMVVSDFLIGFHSLTLIVYATLVGVVLSAAWLKERVSVANLSWTTLGVSIAFFVLTNVGVWLVDGLYPLTAAGLASCFILALPFFGYSLVGNAVYVALLFGGYALAERVLTERQITAHA